MSQQSPRIRRREVSRQVRRRHLSAGIEQLETRTLMAGNVMGIRTSPAMPPALGPVSPPTQPVGAPPFDYSQTFLLHSNPGALRRIYLDFDGHTTTNTRWNSLQGVPASFVTPAYDTDGNPATFANSELEAIQRIFLRVTEDFAPFDVDVTTEYPGEEALIRRSTSDAEFGTRAAIGGSYQDWFGQGAGGVAFLGSFYEIRPTGDAEPSFTFADTQGDDEQIIVETISHEAGHTLGLDHDGTAALGYYGGHGTGATSWSPIMGAGFGINVTQWNNGTYPGADNQEDDVAIISNFLTTGVAYRQDDYGNTLGTATPVQLSSSGSANIAGLIHERTDEDWMSIQLGDGAITIDVSPVAFGDNLDILAQLYDSSGTLIVSDNPVDELNASLTATLRAGTYYIRIDGVGKTATANDPGYSDYGSLGQYNITTSVVPSSHVQGVVYVDGAGDGARQAGDPPAVGFTVFVDDNLNGRIDAGESSTISGAGGFYDLLTAPGVIVKRY